YLRPCGWTHRRIQMNRKTFLQGMACAALSGFSATSPATAGDGSKEKTVRHAARQPKHPRAISMWEFSWIERRWDGAGYEDWDRALDELVERGYNAVRIDPFPHLLASYPHKTWTLL